MTIKQRYKMWCDSVDVFTAMPPTWRESAETWAWAIDVEKTPRAYDFARAVFSAVPAGPAL